MGFELSFEYFAPEIAEDVFVEVCFAVKGPVANADTDWDAEKHIEILDLEVFSGEGVCITGDIDIPDELVYSRVSAFVRGALLDEAFNEEMEL